MDPKKNEPPKKPEKKSNSSSSRIVTMDSIRNRQQEDSESQAYYAGGSEHSGQQILGRDQRGNDDSQALAEALIRASTSRGNNDLSARASIVSLYNESRSVANERGSEYGDMSREPDMMNLLEESRLFSDESGRGQMMDPGMIIRDEPNRPFGGVGRRLGDAEDVETETDEEQFVSPPRVISSVSLASLPRVTLRMWQNGFNVDSGPLFSYSDPSCSELIANIVQGEVPPQILPPECGGDSGPVQVTVIDRRGEKYEESVRYFSGKGHLLGSPTPSVSASGPARSTELSGGSQHVDGTREQSADVSSPIGGRVSPSARQTSKSSAVSVNDFTVDGPTNFAGEVCDTVILKIKVPNGNVIRLSVKGQDDISTVKSYIRRSISSLAGLEFDLLLPYPKRVLGNEEVAGSSEIRSSLLVLRTVNLATTMSPFQL